MDDTSAGRSVAANSNHSDEQILRPDPDSLSVIIPFYNEAECVDLMLDTLLPVVRQLCHSVEVICVDDGSCDNTGSALLNRCKDIPELRVIRLSRNFGQDAAITAGLAHSSGQVVCIMDADLQHPPARLPDMLEAWRRGAEMVCMVREHRNGESGFIRICKRLYYSLLKRISPIDIMPNAGTFRLLDRKACDALLSLTERSRYLYGLYQWIGFPTTYIGYKPDDRVAGETKWTLCSLFNRATKGIISFSSTPLRIWSMAGATIACLAFIYGIYIVVKTLLFGIDLPGFSTLATLILFFSGVILLSIGMIGEYLAGLFEEVKQRPLYLIYETRGFDQDNTERKS